MAASASAPAVKRVRACVVGSGICGLVAAQRLRELDVESVLLEKEAHVGGIWASPSMYKAVTIQQHKSEFVLPGKPWGSDAPDFPSVGHVRRYIREYAEEHKLDEMAQLNAPVRSAAWQPASKTWLVKAANGPAVETDWLAMATGNLGAPRTLDGRVYGGFDGRILHSTEYYHPAPFQGKHVVLIGFGASSVEIAGDLARAGVRVTMLAREEAHADWVLPRFGAGGQPLRLSANGDVAATRRSRHDAARAAVRARLGGKELADVLPEALVPQGEPVDGRIIVSEMFLDALRDGTVSVVAGDARHCGPDSIEYRNHVGGGTIRGVDAIISCVGFDNASGLWGKVMAPAPDGVDLYQTMFAPGVPQAGFLGVGYGFVAAPTFALLHAEGFARAVTGELELPPSDEMRRWIAETKARNLKGATNVFTDNEHFASVKKYLTGDATAYAKADGSAGSAAHMKQGDEDGSSDQEGVLSKVGRELLDERFVVDDEASVKNAYSKWAQSYDADSFDALRFDSPEQCVLHVLAHWPRNARDGSYAEDVQVLDVGCGTGALGGLLRALSNDAPGVVKATLNGFDLTDSMLDVCRERGVYRGRLWQHSMTEYPWPFESDSMDLVMCNGVLIYVKDSDVLEEMVRVTRPGGKAVLMIRVDGFGTYKDKIAELEQDGSWHLVDVSETRNNFPGGDDLSDAETVLYNVYVFEKNPAAEDAWGSDADVEEKERIGG